MTRRTAIHSAETLAAFRAMVANDSDLVVRCEDPLAKHFLSLKYRLMTSIRPQPLLKRAVHIAAPGSYCFTIVRTRHFDEILLAETRSGIEQVVLLGAGYDSRAFRFHDKLEGIRVFEIDHPGTQARKKRILEKVRKESPSNLTYISVDFNHQSFQAALSEHGFSRERKTLFMWEGVTYYLPRAVVEDVLDFVSGCSPGSSIIFDYAIKGFVNGDTSTYGGKQVALWLKMIGEPFLFGLDPTETGEFLASRKLQLVSDLGPEELEKRYLKTKKGHYLGRTLGHVRMVHAKATAVH
jgi:methyltransferase (TIGR00027 family)